MGSLPWRLSMPSTIALSRSEPPKGYRQPAHGRHTNDQPACRSSPREASMISSLSVVTSEALPARTAEPQNIVQRRSDHFASLGWWEVMFLRVRSAHRHRFSAVIIQPIADRDDL